MKNNNKTMMQYFEWYLPNNCNLWKKVINVSPTLKKLGITPLIMGDGDTVINQYPLNTKITPDTRVFLITNSTNYKMPDLKNYSRMELEILFNYLKIPCNIKGNGYLVSQNIAAGEKIDANSQIELTLESKLKVTAEESSKTQDTDT